MAGIQKTNAARLLDRAKIAYRLVPYTVDPDNLAADHVAAELGEDINCVYKTLVLHGNATGHFVCVVPGNREVDLKKAAKVSGNKKAEMIHMKDLLPTTGYIRGGCSPLGMPTSASENGYFRPYPHPHHIRREPRPRHRGCTVRYARRRTHRPGVGAGGA